MKQLLTCMLMLLLASCARETGRQAEEPQPVGDAAGLETLLDGAIAAAEPQGVVLVVVWTTEKPPPEWLEDLTDRWKRYGLIPIGVCVDLLQSESRGEKLTRIREWESEHRLGFPSLIYDGEPTMLTQRLGGDRTPASLTLLSEHGTVLWSGDGFEHADKLETLLQMHLGEPSVAGVLDCCRPITLGEHKIGDSV